MSKIVLHVGMPKTGSTTLQADVFPFISQKSNFQYLGLFQPHRRVKQHPAMSALHKWFVHGESRQALTALLDSALEQGAVLMSNESILSSSIVSDWRRRIERVADVLGGYDATVYLTVREPASAIFSYFVEHYLDAPTGHYRKFADAVKHDIRLDIYRYATSIPFIQSAFGSSVIVEAYEGVLAGNSRFLSSMTSDGQPFPAALGRHNEKRIENDEVVLGRNSTLRDYLRGVIYGTRVGRSVMARNIISSLAPLTRSLDVVQLESVRVPRPSPAEMSRLRDSLQTDIDYLRRHHRIDYSK